MDPDVLLGKMVDAGRGLAGGVWAQIETVAVPELKKIAVQIADLARPDSPWDADEKKMLLQMQIRSAETIIVAMTAITMVEVQKAVNAILDAVRGFVNSKLPIPLL